MAYIPGYIDSTGIVIPTFSDILNDAIAKYKAIYGSDVYLDNDSQDYQELAIISQYIADLYNFALKVGNNQNPQTAVGVNLDGVIKLNSLVRKSSSFSICSVNLTGTAYTLITNGTCIDASGNKWDLPATVTLDSNGLATVTAIAQTEGAITALPGTINQIYTPTYGWSTVTNPGAATPGQPIEADSDLRSRQEVSTSIASQTLLDGTNATLLGVPNVTRCRPYENKTGSNDSNGIFGHSVCFVVEGGDSTAIAEAIRIQKNPGCGTYGTTTVNITDSYGTVIPITYDPVSYDLIDVVVNITALTGYTSTYSTAIIAAVTSYINSIGIGNNLTISGLYGAALSVMSNIANPVFSITSITACIHGNSPGTIDIPIAFNYAAKANTIACNVS